ncbi:MAG: hypothetical protein ACKOA1_05725 [Bacteroidota bacterium]
MRHGFVFMIITISLLMTSIKSALNAKNAHLIKNNEGSFLSVATSEPVLGTFYKCTKTLFSDNPDMVKLLQARKPGYVDNSFLAVSFVKNTKKVYCGSVVGNSTSISDPEAGSYVINSATRTITVSFVNEEYPDETYQYELKSGSNIVSALIIKNQKDPSKSSRLVLINE